MKPVKIFSIKGKDWMDGISLQPSLAVGGRFKTANNYDPFEVMGTMQPSLQWADITSTIATDPVTITPFNDSGTSKLYVQSESKLYEVLDGTPWTVSDETAEIDPQDASNLGVRGTAIYKNRYVYSLGTEIRSNTLPVASASDVQIWSSGFNTSGMWHPMVIGADKNLYVADRQRVIKIVSVTNTTGNVEAATLETGFFVRHMVNDGRYLVLLADNNGTGEANIPEVPENGNYRCQVLYWDMVKSTYDQIYEFQDSYLIAGAFLDGGVYVFSGNGIYVCDIANAPRQIFSWKGNTSISGKPSNPFQVTTNNGSINWLSSTVGPKIYAYGNPIPNEPKVFFNPYTIDANLELGTALATNGTNFYAATDEPTLQILNSGSTRTSATIQTAYETLDQPYKFAYAKVVLRNKLSSGQSVTLGIQTQDGQVLISDNTTKSYTDGDVGAKQTLIFNQDTSGVSTYSDVFEDVSMILTTNANVLRVELWGYPQDNYSQQI